MIETGRHAALGKLHALCDFEKGMEKRRRR